MLELRNVTKKYNAIPVVERVSFSVVPGEVADRVARPQGIPSEEASPSHGIPRGEIGLGRP